MKKALFVVSLLIFVNSICFAQEAGNRIYGNQGYYQPRRQPQTNSGSLLNGNRLYGYSIEASVLLNVKPDAFVVVFGVQQEAAEPTGSNDKVNAKIANFTRSISDLGITIDDIFVDFITQARVYDYSVDGSVARENFTGFETKKTIAVRYKSRDLLERILSAAAHEQIFDLIKVDYIVSDFNAVQNRLFEEAAAVIKKKEAKYAAAFGVKLDAIGLANEKYNAFYPSESYQKYQAFETGSGYVSGGGTIQQRKSFTFFYEPLSGDIFDKAINKLGVEPLVQFTLYLRMDYDASRYKKALTSS